MTCNPSISTAEKPTPHISLKEWKDKVHNFQLFANDQRQKASGLRNETIQARTEALISSTWNRHNTNVLLCDRIEEEKQWMEILEHARQVLEAETELLMEEKIYSEREVEAYYRALSVVSDCMLVRDGRSAIDLNYDDPYKELQTELKLLDASKAELSDKCGEAWDLITRAKELNTVIRVNLNDKTTAFNIDNGVLELCKDSPLTSNKPDVLRQSPQLIAYESWLQKAQSLQSDAEVMSAELAKLREAMKLMRDRARMDYLSQVEATNYALRKRLYDINRLKNELEWQRKNTLEEMCALKQEINRQQECEQQHVDLLKCAETRQENRNMRPGEEMARDQPHDWLLQEIVKLRQTLRDLRDKIDNSICSYNQLESLVVRLDEEIASKEICVQMEMRCVDARCNLVEHDPLASLDKPAVLVKMEKQLAPPPVC